MTKEKAKKVEIIESLYSIDDFLVLTKVDKLHFAGKKAYAKQFAKKEKMTIQDWKELFKKY